MYHIQISINQCGMSSEIYADNIMIYKPMYAIQKEYNLDDSEVCITTVESIITLAKSDLSRELSRHLDPWSSKYVCVEHVYIQYGDTFLRLRDNKPLKEIFDWIPSTNLSLLFFVNVGGASIHCRGYRFTIHTDEYIHQNTPHVHVIKDDVSCRYKLGTFEPMDIPNREFARDYKKIIYPHLIANSDKLNRMWLDYQAGYIHPEIGWDGNQYVLES